MIEKITNQNQIARHKLAEKINEIIYELNHILEERESGIKVYEEVMPNMEPADPYAEQRKWIGKVCRFRDEHFEPDCWGYGVLEDIDDKDPVTGRNFRSSDGYWYDCCEPVKPDDNIIYKGE